MDKKIQISHFTDPLCFWCYAMEPEMRKMRVLLDNQLDYRIVMGVLSSDASEFMGNDEESELRYELFRMTMVDHLTQAAKAVGMPFATEGLFSQRPEEMVSLPLCLAYCAMKMTDASSAEGYLRRMREIVYAEGGTLSRLDEQVELASEFPVDLEQFRSNLESEAVLPVLQEGVDECQKYGVTAFPSLLMEYGNSRLMVSGYTNFDDLRKAISHLTSGEIALTEAEYSFRALESFVKRFGKVAAREIQTMFSLNDSQLANAVMDLVSTGHYKTETCGTSYFVRPV